MPKAIKSYAVNLSAITTDTTATVYTCPASTTAKVIVSYLYGLVVSTGTCALSFGHHPFTATTTALTFNQPPASGAFSPPQSLELYLTAGQTVSYVITAAGPSPVTLKLQMCVIEEAS